jgi:hypothetical protein
MIAADIPTGYVPAKKRRLLLSGYIDYLLFCIPWAILFWAINRFIDEELTPGFSWRFLGFLILETLLVRQIKWSPGNKLLGIRIRNPGPSEQESQESLGGRVFLVEADLLRRETWWTMLLGVLLIQEGAKNIVRCTMWTPPIPFFGHLLGDTSSPLVMLGVGGLSCAIGMGILRLCGYPILLGLVYSIGTSASMWLSWEILPKWIHQYVTVKRAFQGLSVRPGEEEFMQTFMPYAFVVVPLVFALWLIPYAIRTARTRAERP